MNRLCLKIPYLSEDSAQRALEDAAHERSRPKRNVRKVEKRIYPCPLCPGVWHLTSKARR